ncbi:DUF4267 domain-containing protein [Acidobacterium sp. S8]|uniref:DUF4267 domain-containing protein n=1 Tax=Acidobacterium sp. S8 TaxID=1641854 RepID=UPI00131DC313|nr:DUF4267 domain-containing protein [Acidobacterium sp. S8]
MPRDFDLKSPLYWLCGAFALGLLLIGLLALIAPHNAAALFGMPVTTIDALPWVRLAGIRDIALSLMLLAIMAMKAGRIAGILILLMIVVPLTDATTVFTQSGLTYQVLLHAGSIIFMAILGLLLIRQ